MALRLLLVGGGGRSKITINNYLRKKQGFKVMRLDDGVAKFVRDMYKYDKHRRVVWETRIDFYDAMYALDHEMHTGYLLRRLKTTTRDVITPDARYVEEVKTLRALAGYTIIRVTDPPNPKRSFQGLRKATTGTVLLNEAYGKNFENYPVDYSIVATGDPEKLRRNIQNVVDKERAKLLELEKQNETAT